MVYAARKGSLQQPQAATEGEPANLNFFRKQARDRTEVAETELFAASRSIEEAAMQREIAAAAHVEAIQAREQVRNFAVVFLAYCEPQVSRSSFVSTVSLH